MEINKVAIIGAGPAGISTAIQLKRFGIDPIVFESDQIGGLLHNANLVENYPGFPGGIKGVDLIELMKKQFADHDVQLINQLVTELKYLESEDVFEIATRDQIYKAEFVVVASGTKANQLKESWEVISEDIHYEVKDLIELKENHVIIIGAGDAAFDYAINLSKNNEVTILNRGVDTKCLPLLFDRSKRIENINYLENAQLGSLEKEKSKYKFHIKLNEKDMELMGDKLLVAIGREPELSFLNSNLIQKMDELINEERLYFIGDVSNKIYRQTSISVGNGVLTAMKIFKKLLEYKA